MELDIERDSSLSPSSLSPPPLKRRRPSSDLSLSLTLSPSPPSPSDPALTSLRPEERGVRLIQLLLAAAVATADADLIRADALLRLSSTLSSQRGDSLQRLAARLSSALARLLLRRRLPGLLSALGSPTPRPSPAAQLTFARALPYMPLAHAAAVRALIRAVADERVIHAVDLGATAASADLWIPVLKFLSRLPCGAPPHFKLTCVSPDAHVIDSLATALTDEAQHLDLPFRFDPVRSALNRLEPESLHVRYGEALVIVSMLGLHQLGDAADEFLAAVLAMRPKAVVVAEQEADHSSDRLVDRFVEALHHYGAVYDSVEAAAVRGAVGEEEREAVEEVIGAEVEKVVAREGEEGHERAQRWAERMTRAGFRQGRAWWEEEDHGVAGGGYGVVLDRGFLMLCWHQRPLYAVSVWHS